MRTIIFILWALMIAIVFAYLIDGMFFNDKYSFAIFNDRACDYKPNQKYQILYNAERDDYIVFIKDQGYLWYHNYWQDHFDASVANRFTDSCYAKQALNLHWKEWHPTKDGYK